MRKRHYFIIIVALLFLTAIVPTITIEAQTPTPTWIGEYFDNTTRTGSPAFTRIDNVLVFDWGMGSPGTGIGENEFSARWTSNVNLSAGNYRFWVRSDDQVRITVDGRTVINTFANNVVDELISGDLFLNAGIHRIEVDYREFVDEAFIFFDFANLSLGETGPDFATPINPIPSGAWTATYYDNPNLTGNPVAIRGEEQPGDNWGSASPYPAVPVDQWSARWVSDLTTENAVFRITARADDGVRVYIDGTMIIDEWHIARAETYTVEQTLNAGTHTVVVEYYESAGLASLAFDITPIDPTPNANVALVTTGRLNVRTQPNLVSGDILTRISEGERYTALARNPSSTWIQLNANGVIGWVNASYVIVDDLLALPIVNNERETTGYTVTATPYTVNIRTGPGTNFRDIANFERGDTARVIGRNTDATWWQIEYDGVVGWSSARFAQIEADANLSDIPVTS